MQVRSVARAALIAALYAAVTYMLAPVSFGPIQVRVAEALTVLPILFPESIPALWLGCLLANIVGGFGPWDIFGGSGVTLAAAVLTRSLRRSWLAFVPPIVLNAFLVSAYLSFLIPAPYWYLVFTIGIGQSVSVLVLGIPLLTWLKKRGLPIVDPSPERKKEDNR